MKYLINFKDKIKYTLIRLKRNAYYEYLINCKDEIKYTPQLKRYITSSGSASMGVSTMFGTRKKIGIWVFVEVQEISFLGHLKGNMNIVHFCMNFFHFTKKFLLVLTMQAFFNFFFTTPHPLQPKLHFLLILLVDNRIM